MYTKRLFQQIVVVILIIAFTAGCAGQGAAPAEATATATPDLGPERTATAKAEQEAAEQASQTAEAEAQEAKATEDAQATADAQASATAAQKTQDTIDRHATSTQRAAATAKAVAQATAQAGPMHDVVQNLYADGVIASDQGFFIPASDFDQSWAQINYYDYWPVMESVAISTDNFVVTADMAWDSASDIANWDRSGCGFVVYDVDTDRHHFIYLSMDGYANLLYNDGGNTATFKARKPTNSKGIPEGEASFVMAVKGQTITVYVNGVQAFSYTEPLYKPGFLTYSLVSGTNKGYGTHCEMTNVGLWAVEGAEL